MKYDTIVEAIGNTPLVQIKFDGPATILAKLEYLNPGGSIKDRSARYMIEQAEKQGLLKPGGTLIDASSGNQGIAAAMIGAFKGYKVIITVSEKISKEKMDTLKAYGAEVVVCQSTDTLEDPNSYHSQAVALQRKTPNSFMPNQYFNVANAWGHYHSLGPEVWNQTNGEVTHFIAAAGTGGHSSGTGKYLKEKNPNIQVIAADSANSWRSTNGNPKPYKLEGIGIDFESPVFDKTVIDEIVPVRDEDALPMLKLMAQDHGLLIGTSSSAIAYIAQVYAKKLSGKDTVVCVFGDSGRAYLTKGFYS